MLQFSSSNLTVTPWVHGIQIYDRALDEEYFLSLDDLRVIRVAIEAHPEREAIVGNSAFSGESRKTAGDG